MRLLWVVIYGCLTASTSAIASFGNGAGGIDSTITHTDSSDRSIDASIDMVDSGSQEVISSNQTISNIKRIHEEAARTVNLTLSYCQEGAAASDTNGSITLGGMSYVCEVAGGVPQMLSAVPVLLKSAERYPAGSDERKAELDKAQKIIDKVTTILGDDLPEYIEDRSNTAAIGGFFRDTLPIWIIIAICLI